MTHESVQVGVGWSLNVQVSSADIVDGLVINHESTVRVLQGGVGGQDRVVGLNHGGGYLRSGVDGELKFGFLSVVDRQSFHQQGAESRSGTTTEGVEDQESLETGTLVSQFSESVEDEIDDLLSDGVVSTSVVVGGIFFAGDQLLGVEQLSVGSSSDLVNDGGFQVNEDSSRDVLSGTSLAEEGVEGIVTTSDGFVTGHLTIGLDSMFQTVQFPAGITDLDSGLSDVDRDTFTHFGLRLESFLKVKLKMRTD